MDKCTKTPLMKLKAYFDQKRGRFTALANELEISSSYLHQMVDGARPMPHEMAVKVEEFTEGEVSRVDCRPLDGRKVWPELVNREVA